MALQSFSLPLCDDEYFDAQAANSEWFECQCGLFYQIETIRAYNRALDALAEADTLAAQIEEQAELQDAYHRTSLGGTQAAVAAASSMSSAPAYADNEAIKPASNWVQEEANKLRQDANKAPVRAKAARPNRVLPKLSPQQRSTLCSLPAVRQKPKAATAVVAAASERRQRVEVRGKLSTAQTREGHSKRSCQRCPEQEGAPAGSRGAKKDIEIIPRKGMRTVRN